MLPRRIELASIYLDVAGGVWWGKRRREPFLIACEVLLRGLGPDDADVVLADESEPLHRVPEDGASVWRHVGHGLLLREGLPHPKMLERWLATPEAGEFRYQGIHTRMTEAEVAEQLPEDVAYTEGVDGARRAVQDGRWDDAERILLLLSEHTPEYLHHLEREHWLKLYEHKPSLRALNMGFV